MYKTAPMEKQLLCKIQISFVPQYINTKKSPSFSSAHIEMRPLSYFLPFSNKPNFNPLTDIPDLSRRVCLVTGGNSGLGEATLAALAQHNPQKLYLGARSRPRAEAAVARIRATLKAAEKANIEILDLDLSSFESVKAAAAKVNLEAERLDVLQLNAGIGLVPYATSTDGYETQFATNYLGHALLTQLLLPKLLQTAARPDSDVRVVAVSSALHSRAAPEGILFDELKTSMANRDGVTLYAQAALAKTLFAHELAKRYPQIKSVSLQPGGVRTGIWDGEKVVHWLPWYFVVRPIVWLTGVSSEEGAKTQLWCSFSEDVESGRYYQPIGQPGEEGKLTRDNALAAKLWDWTTGVLQGSGSQWP
ncbi:hypothetical protein PFICI_03599 [Pestalotiopsis fici W106-1]|uniref:Oxidoreductase n=1 Tax=Pestalotiopsis fici (strain W106-1 / CGMCC3.15140) TaxID=1229662 RepID=W3XHU5_PESFW|nr:uncharacterized protein PFICI_03599 [Pestalotiopsis fici W106-1]ETS85574.1 hypothetical protein PFICI_03599 [Pestalotiopsis fici W106-1]